MNNYQNTLLFVLLIVFVWLGQFVLASNEPVEITVHVSDKSLTLVYIHAEGDSAISLADLRIINNTHSQEIRLGDVFDAGVVENVASSRCLQFHLGEIELNIPNCDDPSTFYDEGYPKTSAFWGQSMGDAFVQAQTISLYWNDIPLGGVCNTDTVCERSLPEEPLDLTIGILLSFTDAMFEELGDGEFAYTKALDSIYKVVESVDSDSDTRYVVRLVGQAQFEPPQAGTCDGDNTAIVIDDENLDVNFFQNTLTSFIPLSDNVPAYEIGLAGILQDISNPNKPESKRSLLFIYVGNDWQDACRGTFSAETMESRFALAQAQGRNLEVSFCTFFMDKDYRDGNEERLEGFECEGDAEEAVVFAQDIVNFAEYQIAVVEEPEATHEPPPPNRADNRIHIGNPDAPTPTPFGISTGTVEPNIETPDTSNEGDSTTVEVTQEASPESTEEATQEPVNAPPSTTGCQVTVNNTAGINLRASAGTEYPIVAVMKHGITFEVSGTAKDKNGQTWYFVPSKDAWVHSSVVSGCDSDSIELPVKDTPANVPTNTPSPIPSPTEVPVGPGTPTTVPTQVPGQPTYTPVPPTPIPPVGTITITGITVNPPEGQGCTATIHFTVSGGTVKGIFTVKNSGETDPYDENGEQTFGSGDHTYGVRFGSPDLNESHEVWFSGNANSNHYSKSCQ